MEMQSSNAQYPSCFDNCPLKNHCMGCTPPYYFICPEGKTGPCGPQGEQGIPGPADGTDSFGILMSGIYESIKNRTKPACGLCAVAVCKRQREIRIRLVTWSSVNG